MTRFEIVRTDAGHHARIVATNGSIIMSSEVYTRRRGALGAVAVAMEAAGCFANRPPTPDSIPGRYLAVPLFSDADVSFEVRDVDERTAPPAPPAIEWPVFHTQVSGQDYWHDRDTHWRHCYHSDCDEAIPPVGASVRCRLGDIVVTKRLLQEAGQ